MSNYQYDHIAVIGSSGAIGSAFVRQLALAHPNGVIHAFSREPTQYVQENIRGYRIDYTDEASIAEAASCAAQQGPLDLVLVASGILHDNGMMPEKSLRDLSAEKFHHLFAVNTVLPALIAKHFLPKLAKNRRVVFAALSARVGSITDNQLGGWYAYRTSKAALNMIIKTASIEMARRNKQAIIVSLHPGTVDSGLSKPFQANVPEGKLFTPDYSAGKLLAVVDKLTTEDSGKHFAWDGQPITF